MAGVGNPNLKGNKNSGRKPKMVELALALEAQKDRITQEALIELANNKVYKQLSEVGDTYLVAKELGLPLTLKGMTDRSETTLILPKPLLGGESNINGISDNNSDQETTSPEEAD